MNISQLIRSSNGRVLRAATLVALAAMLAAPAAFAGPIFYGDFSEIPPGVVTYTNVFEEANSPGDSAPLYGAPAISPIDPNSLTFFPSGFSASSTGGPLDITDGQLNFGIEVESGAGLTLLTFSEGGDFSFAGSGGAGTTVAANLLVTLFVLEVDGVALPAPIEVNESARFSTDLATEGEGGDFWDLDLVVDLAADLPAGFSLGATKLAVAINNQLVTNSEEDTLAIIAKKDFSVTPGGPGTDPNVIPEPSTLAILLLGLGAGVSRRR